MTIFITATMLCDLCGDHFTSEGAEALYNHCEEMKWNGMSIGDLLVSFAEIPADWEDEIEDETIIARLQNGNILIAR